MRINQECERTSEDVYKRQVQDVTHRSPQCESARLLQVTARGGGQEKTIYALNEMRIENVTKTQLMDIDINGSFFETFRGTGLCLCTQIGSTAYKMCIRDRVIAELDRWGRWYYDTVKMDGFRLDAVKPVSYTHLFIIISSLS